METVKVYSPIEDKDIRTNLNNSPIWKQAYHESEYKDVLKKYIQMFEYSIKFDGLKPIQVINIRKLAK
jgi:hypothetical protein